MLERVLLGQDPVSRVQLVSSAGAVEPDHSLLVGAGGEVLSVREAAALIGVDESYVRRVAANTTKIREANATSTGVPVPGVPSTFLDGVKVDGRW